MRLFTPNIEFTDLKDRARFLLGWRLCLAITPVLFILTIVFALKGSLNAWAYGAGLVLPIGSLIYMRLSGGYKGFYISTGLIATVVIHYSANTFINEPHFSDTLWILLIVLAAYFGVGVKWGSALLAINMLGISYFVFFTLDQHLKVYNNIGQVDAIGLTVEFISGAFSIGYVIAQFVKIQRVTEVELMRANKELEENNQLISHRDYEKTVLLKEIHHRVKNNLQIIISLLRLQQSEMENSEARSKFHEMTNRVMVMSSIHQKLYQQEDLTNIDLQQYVSELASELTEVYQAQSKISMDIRCEYEQVDLKTIVPLGLLLNELLSNSFKYAFQEMDYGRITIQIQEKNKDFDLHYADNGNWKPSDQQGSSFGLELIDILTEQLNGNKELDLKENGTSYVFHLKKLIE